MVATAGIAKQMSVQHNFELYNSYLYDNMLE